MLANEVQMTAKKTTQPKAGRPTKFRKEFIEQARKLCLIGATDDQVADFLGVDPRTIYRWKNENEEFCKALRVGKEEADARVVRSLYQRAVGYEHEDVKIFMPAGADAPVYAPFTAKVQPDTTAQIFWLKNRDPENWRDKVTNELTGPNGGPIQVKEMSDDDLLAIATGSR